MVLPSSVTLCDSFEIAAIVLSKPIFYKDLLKQFSPTHDFSLAEAQSIDEVQIREALDLAQIRKSASMEGYPFVVTERSIEFEPPQNFNAYLFMLLGHSLNFGGPANVNSLLRRFRTHFEDVVSWSFKKAGFAAEVLSEPRGFRGLDVPLAAALRQVSDHLKEGAILREDKLVPHDNDLCVDVLATPYMENSHRSGSPTFQIQCATGSIRDLQGKLDEGAGIFGDVWETGFFRGCGIRGVATPDDLLIIEKQYWDRLGGSGWVLDRTRIAHLSTGIHTAPLLREVSTLWEELWESRAYLDWQTAGSEALLS